eukprot:1125395-Prymnesium_polylepis.1
MGSVQKPLAKSSVEIDGGREHRAEVERCPEGNARTASRRAVRHWSSRDTESAIHRRTASTGEASGSTERLGTD